MSAASTAPTAGGDHGAAALPGLGDALPYITESGCIYLDYNGKQRPAGVVRCDEETVST